MTSGLYLVAFIGKGHPLFAAVLRRGDRELRSRLAVLDCTQAGEGTEGEHKRLVAARYGHHAVTTRDFLTSDRAAIVDERQRGTERVRPARIFRGCSDLRARVWGVSAFRVRVYDSANAACSDAVGMSD
jgi:hypothetical protein